MTFDSLAYAFGGTNLRDHDERLMPLDYVKAAGVAAREHELGLSLFRIKWAGQHRELKRVFQCLCDKAGSREVAEQVLGHWLFDACPGCDGRGHPVIQDTPILDEKIECEECRGTGTLPEPLSWGQWHQHLYAEIRQAVSQAYRAVEKQLVDDISD